MPVIQRFSPIKRTLTAFLIISFGLVMAACSTPKLGSGELTETSLYEQAQTALRQGNYITAIEDLRRLEADFPFGNYARSAQLSLIYAYYQSNELALADASAARFIRLHPNDNNVDYAYYLRGLSSFPESADFFQSIFSSDLSRKSMRNAQDSFLHFSQLIDRFPDSLYADDTLQRMAYLRNLMARHELNIANHYLDYKAYSAAINRAQYVLENFQKATAIPDALAVQVKAYRNLGLTEQADTSLSLLKTNYPDYPAIQEDGSFDIDYTEERSRSIGRWLTFGLISNSKPPGFDTRDIYGQ